MRFHHNYGYFSCALKLLCFFSLVTLALSLWCFKVWFPFYYLMANGNLLAIIKILDWPLILFFICVLVIGFHDKPYILYFFPFVAYSVTVSDILHFINYHSFVYDLHLPGMLYSLSVLITTLTGLITLLFWHRSQPAHRKQTYLSTQVKKNLKVISLLTYIVLILDSMMFYQEFPYYLEKVGGMYAIALLRGGINNTIFWVIILIAMMRKWPYVLWLFPLIAIDYLWPYLTRLVTRPGTMTTSLTVLVFAATSLITLGIYTLIIWVRDNRQILRAN